jgi:S-adenosylmethionine:tRNA ribosyltransferase-isomerase
MRVDAFDFALPDELIALRPARPRDAARLMVVSPPDAFSHLGVRDLPDQLAPGDVLVFNDAKVVPAALEGMRHREEGASARVSFNLIERLDPERWRALARPAKRLRPGDRVVFGAGRNVCALSALEASIEERGDSGEAVLSFDLAGRALDEAIAALGSMPLPPYIASRRAADDDDRADYQTMFAAEEGAVAAPTAGLHFTPELMASLAERGVSTARVTLMVGAGTFLPVRADDTDAHRMHAERARLDAATAARLNAVRAAGGRVIAVGTTALRTLESAASRCGTLEAFDASTDIFITPGYRFRAVDLLMTNFHLPRSTLFMLVSAFSGLGTMQAAYRQAIETRYRFFSYGDACLLFPAPNPIVGSSKS